MSAPTDQPREARFRPDIEGLRAVAVFLVLMFHGRLGLDGGFVGVDVFFVVSGFLITSLLVREGRSGSISLAEFWARRVRRLLAASALVVVVTLAASYVMLEPTRHRLLAADAVAAAGFAVNFRFALLQSNYLSGLALPSPLLHYWSLSLEEQFYLVWPLIVASAAKLRRFEAVLGALACLLAAVSLAVCYVYTPITPSFAYFLLPMRAWELLAGAGLALLEGRLVLLPSWFRSFAGWAGLAAILGSALSFGETTAFPGLAALVPVLGATAVIIAGTGSQTLPARALGWAPLVWLGSRSYSIYLWHWPLLVLSEARFGLLGTAARAGLLVLSIAFSTVSYAYVEQWARRHAWLSARPIRSLLAGASMSLAVLGIGLGLRALSPARAAENVDPGVAAVAPPALPPTRAATFDDGAAAARGKRVPVGRVLLIGDSTMAALRWFDSGRLGLRGFDYTLDVESCRRIALPSCMGREDRIPSSIAPTIDGLRAKNQSFDTVVVMAGYHSTKASFGDEFEALVKSVRVHGAKRMVFIALRESLAFPAPGSHGKASVYGMFNSTVRDRIATGTYPEVTLLDWNAYSGSAPRWFRVDGIHSKLSGAISLGEYLSDALAALEGRPCPRSDSVEPCRISTAASDAGDVLARYGLKATDLHRYEQGAKRSVDYRSALLLE